jgi:hypothetical protein
MPETKQASKELPGHDLIDKGLFWQGLWPIGVVRREHERSWVKLLKKQGKVQYLNMMCSVFEGQGLALETIVSPSMRWLTQVTALH